MMKGAEKKPSYSSIHEAESTIKDQVLSLSHTYLEGLNHLVNSLKRAVSLSKDTSDYETIQSLLNEGEDHIHNLNQLIKELETISNQNRNTLLEISAEVLAKTIKYLDEAPKKINETNFKV